MTNKTEQIIFHFLNKGYGDLTEYRTDEYPNKIFYIRDKKVYMEQDKENGTLFVDYDTIWEDLVEWFSMEHEEIQQVISKWVEQTYNIRGVKPRRESMFANLQVEQTYNIRGIKPVIPTELSEFRWKRLTI